MHTDQDVSRIVRSWLQTDEHESATNIVSDVLARLDAIPQHRSWWPVRRNAQMNGYAKLAIAAAAVLLVAVVGLNLMPIGGGLGGPAASPTPSPSPTPTATATPAASPAVLPELGSIPVGRFLMVENGQPFTMEFSTEGWARDVGADRTSPNLEKNGGMPGPDTAWMPIWGIDGVFTDPCRGVRGPKLSPSASALAAAVASLPNTEVVTAPEKVTVGGREAMYVAIRFHDDVGCAPSDYKMWWDDHPCGGAGAEPCGRFVTAGGETNYVWIVEINGTHVWIEAETYKGAKPEVQQEIQRMIDSIRFT
jgi:hypothetical protein